MKKWFILHAIALPMLILFYPCTPHAASKPVPSIKKEVSTAAKNMQPQPGGIYKVILRTNSNIFGYPPRWVGSARDFAPPFFDHLLSVGDDGKYQPELALSWDISKDGKAIIFKLRQGVTFHDGTPFNAQAVKSNIENLIRPDGPIVPGITSVDIVDEYTVKLNLPAYNNLILHHFAANPATWMYSPTALQKNGEDWALTHPVGTGPFMLKEYTPNISLILVKNPNYWKKNLPYLDGIIMTMVPEPMTQMLTFKAGQANAIYAAPSTAATQLRKDGYALQIAPGSLYVMNFDTKNSEIFSKLQVRQAIEYAIDKEAICDGPGEGLYKSVYQLIPSDYHDYNPACPPRKYDPTKAKKLLTAAGYPNGFSFKIYSSDTNWKDGWVAVQSYLEKVGIRMEINYLNVAAWNLIRSAGKIEKGAAAFASDTPSSNALFTLDTFWRSNSAIFPYIVKPSGIDELIDQAKLSRNPANVSKINRNILKMIYDDETVVPIFQNLRIAIVDKSVRNTGWFIHGDEANNKFGHSTWLSK